jgi:hypothetical protein
MGTPDVDPNECPQGEADCVRLRRKFVVHFQIGCHTSYESGLDRTRQRRVQISTRRSGSLERCWTALPIAPAGARPVKSAGALVLATGCRGRE